MKMKVLLVIIGIAFLVTAFFIDRLPKKEEERLWLQCNTTKTSDSTHTISARVIKIGDSKIYGRKQFEYKTRNVDYIVSYQKAYKEMWNWYADIVNKE
ncbi:hypothetical protein LCGC14_0364640 [marine sediment metagenome]|uniref:Uncharacterized protein n=1 Tax=marine sediment metagenome TaxID=412755 RepID=A0A0F9TPT7_9ZZZZ